jgi:hypothetical protein
MLARSSLLMKTGRKKVGMETLDGKRRGIFAAEEQVMPIVFVRLSGLSLWEKRLLRDLQRPEA